MSHTEGAPQIQLDTGNYPNLDPSAPSNRGSYMNGENAQDAKNRFVSSAQSAMESVQNHPFTQNVKETVNNGPVAQNVKAETAKTQSEFRDLANARTTPDQPAATGQPLTHYHSLFYRLLSWKNPRATAITYLMTVLFIFAARYLNIIGFIFKALYYVLGITATAEVVGRAAFGNGFASQMRPRKYYVVPRESLERFTEDVEQLINFFVIETQRIIFAENVYVTIGAFFASLISYFLIKFVPLWGLALIATSVMYLGPLVYIKNKDLIDNQLHHAGEIINQQAHQVRDMTAHHASRASETVKTYAGEYTHKAQELMGHAKQRTVEKKNQAADYTSEKTNQAANYTSEKADQASNYASEKTSQAQGYASEKTGQAQDYASEKTSQAQGYADEKASQARGYADDKSSQAQGAYQSSDYPSAYQSSDFPRPPREEPVANPRAPEPAY